MASWLQGVGFYPKSPFYYAVVTIVLGMSLALLGHSYWLSLFLSLFIAFMIASVAVTWLQLKGLEIIPLSLERGFVDQTLYLMLEVREKIGISRDTLRFQWKNENRVSIELDPFEKKTIRIAVKPLQRGHFKIDSIRCFSDYPLGLFEISKLFSIKMNTIVYAKPLSHDEVKKNKDAKKISEQLDDPSDFYGFRNYHPGDSLKAIAWKQWSKGDLLTKLFSKKMRREVWIDAKSQEFSENTLSWLTRLVLDAHKSEKKYGLRLPQVVIKPNLSEAHRHACLKAIATWKMPK